MSKKIVNIIVIIIGYILSPLSWWNDLLVNLPISYLLAIPFGYINRSLFIPVVILNYWITNILGIMLMHYGTLRTFKKSNFSKKDLAYNIAFSTLYSVLMVILFKIGILSFPSF